MRQAAGIRRLETNLRPRRSGFALTPLVDVIFLLLKFFMLTSLIAPYGLLQVTSANGGNAVASAPATGSPEAKPVILRISRGLVTAGGQTIAISELPAAIEAMKKAGAKGVTLLTSRSATVQDVVSVLEAFKVGSFSNVTLLNQAGG